MPQLDYECFPEGVRIESAFYVVAVTLVEEGRQNVKVADSLNRIVSATVFDVSTALLPGAFYLGVLEYRRHKFNVRRVCNCKISYYINEHDIVDYYINLNVVRAASLAGGLRADGSFGTGDGRVAGALPAPEGLYVVL